MFQDFQLFPHMTVMQNLIYAPRLNDQSTNYEEGAFKKLENLGLKNKAHDYPSKLSGGQKQRVALARILMMQPDILLCDEPTSGLDVATTEDVVALLKSVRITMIIASHDLDFLTKVSDRIILMKSGHVVCDMQPHDHHEAIEKLKAYY
jgi:polar amino acid transport system ATP-binding protein